MSNINIDMSRRVSIAVWRDDMQGTYRASAKREVLNGDSYKSTAEVMAYGLTERTAAANAVEALTRKERDLRMMAVAKEST